MKRILLTLFSLSILFVAVGSTNSAIAQQTLFGIGPKAGLYLKGHPMVGLLTEFPLTQNIILEPGFELILPGNSTTRLVVEGNIRYAFLVAGDDFSPYLLAGPGLSLDIVSLGGQTETDTDFRLNIGGGVFLNTRSRTQYWAGIKAFILAEADSDVLLQGGVIFYL